MCPIGLEEARYTTYLSAVYRNAGPVELTLVRLQGPAHDVNRENERLRDGFDLIRMGKN